MKSSDEKRQDIARLTRRIEELEAFDPSGATKRFSLPAVTSIETAVASTLASVFGQGTPEYNRYSRATRLDNGPIQMAGPWSRGHDEAAEAQKYLSDGKAAAVALLRQAVNTLEEEIEFAPPALAAPAEIGAPAAGELTRKVFVVHGHDEGAREMLARFLEKIGFDPIILHEQANQGRTIIEKVEAHGNVGFAVVLLTGDDEGRILGTTELRPRARQNVLLELGYFIGRLGRERVCALKRGDVELPSDFAGVVWETMDASTGWKQALGRELQAAGHPIDWNKVMGP